MMALTARRSPLLRFRISSSCGRLEGDQAQNDGVLPVCVHVDDHQQRHRPRQRALGRALLQMAIAENCAVGLQC